MNTKAYEKYIRQFVREALQNSDGTPSSAAKHLRLHANTVKLTFFTFNPMEKTQAYLDVIKVFETSESIPVALANLGLDPSKLGQYR